jgi:hypothetical protein
MYSFESYIGLISIRPESGGWYLWVNDGKIERFYPTVEEAADAVSFRNIGIVAWDLHHYSTPPDLSKWRRERMIGDERK